MKRRPRRYFTQAEIAEMCYRWEQGESLSTIARDLGRYHSALQGALARTGGKRPAPKWRSRLASTLAEREEIYRGIAVGLSVRTIAAQLGRAPSTVSREIQRNGGPRRWRANAADDAAWQRAQRPKTCKLVQHPALARIVARQLMKRWSPRPIAGWLKHMYPDDEAPQVSHETIYKTLFIQAREALKKGLIRHPRRSRATCRSRHHTQTTADHGRILDAVSIRERPAAAKDRAIPGHWEGDLFVGSNNGQIGTLVERHTCYVMLVRAPSTDTKTVIEALIKQAHKLLRELYKLPIWDHGKEMVDQKRFSIATNIQVCFCDPQQPWQRGSNENTNGLLRQYFPKGMDLSNVHQNRLNAVARQLNERPREGRRYNSIPRQRNLPNVLRRQIETAT